MEVGNVLISHRGHLLVLIEARDLLLRHCLIYHGWEWCRRRSLACSSSDTLSIGNRDLTDDVRRLIGFTRHLEEKDGRAQLERMEEKRLGSRSENWWDLACTMASNFICVAGVTVWQYVFQASKRRNLGQRINGDHSLSIQSAWLFTWIGKQDITPEKHWLIGLCVVITDWHHQRKASN
jgi:hypothetical protein